MPSQINLPPTITAQEIGLFLSFASPIISYLIARYFDRRRLAAEAAKVETEAKKTAADTKKSESEARKVEADVAQSYISSASSLVEEYKEMLKNVMDKQDALEKKLDKEIASRRKGERVIKELYRGIKILLKQMYDNNIDPDWCVEDNIVTIIEAMDKEEQ